MPIKACGILFLAAAWLLRREFSRARSRGCVQRFARRIHRDEHPVKFSLALASRALGAIVCFVAAYLCLTGGRHEF